MNSGPGSMIAPIAQTAVESILHVAWRFPLWLTLVLALSLGFMIFGLYLSERGRRGKGCAVAVDGFSLFALDAGVMDAQWLELA